MVTVSNTSPLFNLAIIDRLGLVGRAGSVVRKKPTVPIPMTVG